MVKYTVYSKATFVIMVALLSLLIVSCNPYKRLTNRPPITSKDSAALLARCVKLLPVPAPSDTAKPLIVFDIPDSNAYYKALADSIAKTKQTVEKELWIKYKDTCTSAIAIYQDGFTIGYKMGKYEGIESEQSKNSKTIRKIINDCDSLHNIELNKVKRAYELRLTAAENAMNIAQNSAEKHRNKYSRLIKWTWGLSIAFLLAVIMCIILWKFKRQARAANNILNDVRDIAK